MLYLSRLVNGCKSGYTEDMIIWLYDIDLGLWGQNGANKYLIISCRVITLDLLWNIFSHSIIWLGVDGYKWARVETNIAYHRIGARFPPRKTSLFLTYAYLLLLAEEGLHYVCKIKLYLRRK